MKRLGKFTGRVYDESDIQHIQECSIVIDENISAADLYFLRYRNRFDCLFCVSGPDSCKEKIKAEKNGG